MLTNPISSVLSEDEQERFAAIVEAETERIDAVVASKIALVHAWAGEQKRGVARLALAITLNITSSEEGVEQVAETAPVVSEPHVPTEIEAADLGRPGEPHEIALCEYCLVNPCVCDRDGAVTPEPVLIAKDAAELLCVPLQKIYDQTKTGRLAVAAKETSNGRPINLYRKSDVLALGEWLNRPREVVPVKATPQPKDIDRAPTHAEMVADGVAEIQRGKAAWPDKTILVGYDHLKNTWATTVTGTPFTGGFGTVLTIDWLPAARAWSPHVPGTCPTWIKPVAEALWKEERKGKA